MNKKEKHLIRNRSPERCTLWPLDPVSVRTVFEALLPSIIQLESRDRDNLNFPSVAIQQLESAAREPKRFAGVFSVDYPWDVFSILKTILEQHWQSVASHYRAYERMSTNGHVFVSESALVEEGVVFRGPALIGSNAVVRTGAILGENVVVDSSAVVEEYCRVARFSYVGRGARVGHAAEVSGCLMANSIAKHFCYFRGVLGEGANVGAGTACGTTRFDGGASVHRISGMPVDVDSGANEVYFGAGARTGVNASILAGSMLGANSIVGPGVVFNGYLGENERAQS